MAVRGVRPVHGLAGLGEEACPRWIKGAVREEPGLAQGFRFFRGAAEAVHFTGAGQGDHQRVDGVVAVVVPLFLVGSAKD